MTRALLIALLALLLLPATAHAGTRLLAPAGTCPNDTARHVDQATHRKALRCLIRYARAQVGAPTAHRLESLHWTARKKTLDVIRCGFSHTACGRPVAFWALRSGFGDSCRGWLIGENLARGYYTARGVMAAWLNSASHRHILLANWRHIGTSYRPGSGVWALEAGRCV